VPFTNPKSGVRRVGVSQAIELGVVEGVEALSVELEVSPIAEGKGLGERGGEVGAARANHGILAGVAEAQIRAAQEGVGFEKPALLTY
jgi:hypothetical protein